MRRVGHIVGSLALSLALGCAEETPVGDDTEDSEVESDTVEETDDTETADTDPVVPDCLRASFTNLETYAPAAVRASFLLTTCDGAPYIAPLAPGDIDVINGVTGEPFSASLEGGGASAPASVAELLDETADQPGVTTALHALVALDLSNSVVSSGGTDAVIDAALSLAQALVRDADPRIRYSLGIQVFGRTDATRIAQPFTTNYAAIERTLEDLRESEGLGSTNLYGAYGAALVALSQRSANADLTDRTLILFTDGRHEAGAFDELRDAALVAKRLATDQGISIYSVAVGAPGDDLPFLEELASEASNFDVAAAAADLAASFQRTAETLANLPKATYVVGVCTPVELGTPELTVRVRTPGASASATATYDTSVLNGDVGGCEPEQVVRPCMPDLECDDSPFLEGYSCGTCGPDATCASGYCTCPVEQDYCGTVTGCDALQTSLENCGACGFECGPRATCATGTCTCPGTEFHCSATIGCQDLLTSSTSCGNCGTPCPGPEDACVEGTCVDVLTPFLAAVQRIPAGSFEMGCLAGRDDGVVGGCAPEESPVRTVTLSRAFDMSEAEVSQAVYKAITGENPSEHTSCGPHCPVEGVDYNDVTKFLDKLNAALGLATCPAASNPYACTGWRLPTEAEWEYAARGGQSLVFPGSATASAVAQYDAAITSEPCLKARNGYQLCDMAGNVSEWTSDWFATTYPTGAETDPVGAATGNRRSVRGGSAGETDLKVLRISNRQREVPSFSRRGELGFRIVRSVP